MADLKLQQPPTVNEEELERLKRDYLPMWAMKRMLDRVSGRGAPSEIPFVDYMKPHPSDSSDADERPDSYVCVILDMSIDELTGVPGFGLARSALAVRYMSAGLPSVFRAGRLQGMPAEEVENLADGAERRLVGIVKRRGLPL